MLSLIDNLNESQKEAVLSLKGPVLVLAGAGSGKTKVLTHRMAYLINEGVKPYNIFAVTFTNKAAEEMKERIINILDYDSSDLWVSTFHSAALRILRREISNLNFPSNFVIFDTTDQKSLIKECLKERDINEKILTYQAVMGRISRAKNELVSPEEYSDHYSHQYLSQIVDLYTLYQKKLRRNNALDFDDLIFFTVKLFRRHPDVLEKYQNMFKYIMVDEYQDINKAQYQLIKLLASKNRNLFVVGDEDQSIYAFRGADMRIILNFEKDFSDAKIIKLQQNYRSTQNILDAANELVRNNQNRREKKLWTDNKVRGNKPFCYEALDERDEAIFVIDEIKKLCKSDGCVLNDFVILYRTNAQSRVFEEVLIGEGLPYQIIGGLKFYDRKEIKDVVAYLRFIANMADLISLKRIINLPARGIGDKSLEKLMNISLELGMPVYDIISDSLLLKKNKFPAKVIEGLTSFKELIDRFLEEKDKIELSKLIELVVEESGYLKSLKDQNNAENVSRIENLEELMKVAQEFTYRFPKGKLEDFLSFASLSSDIDNLEHSDSITLMTVHSAKGLEFPVVFIAGMEENMFPHQRSIDSSNEADIEEERRLAYVAVTRAMKRLYLSYAWRRMSYGGGSIYNEPSRFLEEIATCIDRPVEQKELFSSDYDENDSIEIELSRLKTTNNNAPSKPAFYRIGDTVKHKEFGQGFVLEVMGSGLEYKLKVSFPRVGLRKIDVSSLI